MTDANEVITIWRIRDRQLFSASGVVLDGDDRIFSEERIEGEPRRWRFAVFRAQEGSMWFRTREAAAAQLRRELGEEIADLEEDIRDLQAAMNELDKPQ